MKPTGCLVFLALVLEDETMLARLGTVLAKLETTLEKFGMMLVRLRKITADLDTISACTPVEMSYAKSYR